MSGVRYLFLDRKCRCTVGGCTNCSCVRYNTHCSRDCSCGEACTNKPGQALTARQINALNAALVALAAGLDAQQANQQQLGNALQALAARVVPAAQNPQGVGVVVPPPVAQSSARGPITLGAEVVYSGSPIESIVDRMQLVNKKATAENWGDDEKQRLAAYSLSGVALTWQENIGITLQN